MKKVKDYFETRFSAETIREAAEVIDNIAKQKDITLKNDCLSVGHDDAMWDHDSFEEFFADYRKFHGQARFSLWGGKLDLDVVVDERQTRISVVSSSRPEIEAVFDVFEKHLKDSLLPPLSKPPVPKIQPIVFIGHGRSLLWRDLKDHLQDMHKIKVEAYETGARAGHTIRDILEDMATKSSFALLVLTAEDLQADGTYHARQNVIHETGLFQGKLGFARAVVLLEEGAEEFSNLQGIQQIRFSKGNIRETFGEVVATVRREFE